MNLTKGLVLSIMAIALSGCETASGIANDVSSRVADGVSSITTGAGGNTATGAEKNLQEFKAWLLSSPAMQSYKIRGTKFSNLIAKETTIAGMYSLSMSSNGERVAYVSSDSKYIVAPDGWREILSNRFSDVLSANAQIQLDRERIFSKVNLNEAIVYKFGSGEKRTYLLFSAIDCPYSRKLEVFLAQNASNPRYNATVYVFPSTLNRNAEKQVQAIWCSNDPAGNWRKATTQNTLPRTTNANGCNYTAKTAHRNDLEGMLRITGFPKFTAPGGISGRTSINPALTQDGLGAMLSN